LGAPFLKCVEVLLALSQNVARPNKKTPLPSAAGFVFFVYFNLYTRLSICRFLGRTQKAKKEEAKLCAIEGHGFAQEMKVVDLPKIYGDPF